MTRFIYLAPTILFLFGAAACSSEDEGSRRNVNGSGNGSGDGNGTGGGIPSGDGDGDGSGGLLDPNGGGGGDDCSLLPVTYRDFKGYGEDGGHPDFEVSARGVTFQNEQQQTEVYMGWNDVGCGMVQAALGADSKPVLFTGMPDTNGGVTMPAGVVGYQRRAVSGPGCHPATSGICNIGLCEQWIFAPPTYEIQDVTTFGQWYNDSAWSETIEDTLQLAEDPPESGTYVYDSTAFFPLDGKGFGNTPGQEHNYHFTTEIHVKFKYEAQQLFTFRGDDDLWIFVNGKLALDVGGLHQALQGTIDFDAIAAQLGITPGETYQMDIFHAERQTSESNFRIETNISCFEPVVVR